LCGLVTLTVENIVAIAVKKLPLNRKKVTFNRIKRRKKVTFMVSVIYIKKSIKKSY